MIDPDLVHGLVAEAEETLEVEGAVGLYDFSWSLRGLRTDISEEQVTATCRAAYEEFRSRHELRLVWVDWPITVEDARDAVPGTPLDFDLDPGAPVATPLLTLVPSPGRP